jgi:NADH-quinone oxidoreductase subunit L
MSQTLSVSTLLAVPLLPLAGAVLAGVFGTVFGGNWIGRRLSHALTILSGVCFVGDDAQKRGHGRRSF